MFSQIDSVNKNQWNLIGSEYTKNLKFFFLLSFSLSVTVCVCVCVCVCVYTDWSYITQVSIVVEKQFNILKEIRFLIIQVITFKCMKLQITKPHKIDF